MVQRAKGGYYLSFLYHSLPDRDPILIELDNQGEIVSADGLDFEQSLSLVEGFKEQIGWH